MILIIACGNSLRQDDRAGLILARRLASAWQAKGLPVRFLPVQQLVPELSLEIASNEVKQVWFVDSRRAAGETDPTIRIRPLDPAEDSPALGHHMSPETLLLYAQSLFDERPAEARPSAWELTMPGFRFGHSETLSEACKAAVDLALGQAAALF